MAGADAATGVMVVPRSDPDHTAVVSWLNEKTSFDFYLLQVEAYRIDDSAPAPVLTLVSGPAGATPPPENALRDVPEASLQEAGCLTAVPEAPEDTYSADEDKDAGQEAYTPYEPPADEVVEPTSYFTAGSTGASDEEPDAAEQPSAPALEEPNTAAPETAQEEPAETTYYEAFSGDAAAETSETEPLAYDSDVAVEQATSDEASDDEPQGHSEEVARWFWGELLSKAEQRTRVHADVSPPGGLVASASAGPAGLTYNYVIGDHEASIELYINRGEDRDSENETIFNALQATQDAIEYNFGGPLDWQREPDADGALRIGSQVGDAGLHDEGRWPDVQDAMVDAMVRLERAMRPHVARLQI
jgi:hypothetical protein